MEKETSTGSISSQDNLLPSLRVDTRTRLIISAAVAGGRARLVGSRAPKAERISAKLNGVEGLGERLLCLFDMDGVLYNSMPNHAIAWVQAMASYGIRFTEADSYATEGARGVDTVRRFVKEQTGKDISEEEAMEMYQEKARIFGTLPVAEVMPGAKQLMQKIKAQGLTIGVVTGSAQRPLIARILEDFSEFITEDHIVTAYDVKRGKPNPDPYLMGMRKCSPRVEVRGERLEVREFMPEETIVVENAPLGIRAGKAAGAYTIAVNTGPLPDETLLEAGADVLFSSMQELADAWPITE